MQLNITGHHVDITPPLKSYVEEKIQKITKRFNNITNVHVVLTIENHKQNLKVQKAEAHVNLAKGDIHATAEADDMYAAIDAMSDKLDRQVIKHKEKLSNHGDGEAI